MLLTHSAGPKQHFWRSVPEGNHRGCVLPLVLVKRTGQPPVANLASVIKSPHAAVYSGALPTVNEPRDILVKIHGKCANTTRHYSSRVTNCFQRRSRGLWTDVRHTLRIPLALMSMLASLRSRCITLMCEKSERKKQVKLAFPHHESVLGERGHPSKAKHLTT